MIAPELIEELRLIAFIPKSKPLTRVNALASLARNGIELDKVRETLFSIATAIDTPDSVKVRAIDLLDKLDITAKPKDLSPAEETSMTESLLKQYVGSPEPNT